MSESVAPSLSPQQGRETKFTTESVTPLSTQQGSTENKRDTLSRLLCHYKGAYEGSQNR